MTNKAEPTQTSDATDGDGTAIETVEQPIEPAIPPTESEAADAAQTDVATSDTNEPAQTDTAVQAPYEVSSESRNWATFAHLSAFVMFIGIPSLIGPLVVWLAKKDDPYVEAQAKEALNFNISMLIYAIAAAISILLVIGIIALPAVFIAWFVLVIVAAIRSADGEQYRYPFTIRLVS